MKAPVQSSMSLRGHWSNNLRARTGYNLDGKLLNCLGPTKILLAVMIVWGLPSGLTYCDAQVSRFASV